MIATSVFDESEVLLMIDDGRSVGAKGKRGMEGRRRSCTRLSESANLCRKKEGSTQDYEASAAVASNFPKIAD